METESIHDGAPEEHPAGVPEEGPVGVGEGGLPHPDGIESSETSIDEVDGLLEEVEHALSRLDDGTYGTCASCGGPIDDGRLAESPTAQSCSACLLPSGV